VINRFNLIKIVIDGFNLTSKAKATLILQQGMSGESTVKALQTSYFSQHKK
jgi:hypothetical protein